jgi:hypothetical protein
MSALCDGSADDTARVAPTRMTTTTRDNVSGEARARCQTCAYHVSAKSRPEASVQE